MREPGARVRFAGTVNVIDGIVDSITVTNGGTNYGLGTQMVVTLTGTKGKGFVGQVNYAKPAVTESGDRVLLSNGPIQSIEVIDGGSGYGPVVSIGGPGTGAKAKAVVSNGVIQSIDMVSNGQDYSSAPKVMIKSLTGNGAEATAVTASNAILGASVTNTGFGYPGGTGEPSVSDDVTITFSGGDGKATANVVTQGSCFLGVDMCAQQSVITSELENLFLVRIPGSFMASSAANTSQADLNTAVGFAACRMSLCQTLRIRLISCSLVTAHPPTGTNTVLLVHAVRRLQDRLFHQPFRRKTCTQRLVSRETAALPRPC